MNDLDLLYTDVEDDLRATVRAVLADHCDPAWIGAAVSAAGAESPGTTRACDPAWLIVDLPKGQSQPSRTAFRWSDAGWTSFAQAHSAGCAEILAAERKFPVALCKALPAPA